MQNLVAKIKSSGLSPDEISNKSDILIERIIGIMQGEVEPSIKDVRKIAKALRISPEFLINDSKQIPTLDILYRKNISNKEKNAIEHLSFIVNNILEVLDGHYAPFDVLSKFSNVEQSAEGAATLATNFRNFFFQKNQIEPILNLPEIIARELNCILIVQEIGNNTDGASLIVNGIPIIILSPRFEARMLFTLSHELGHLLAHHNDKNFAVIDKNVNLYKKQRLEEAFAHAFASELLMPRTGVGMTLRAIRKALDINGDNFGDVEVLYLSRLYGVSFEVAALRCENLEIVPKGTAASLYESLVKEHRNPENRARQLNLPERTKIRFPKVSSNLLWAANQKIQSGEMSLEKASELLMVSVIDIINYNSTHE